MKLIKFNLMNLNHNAIMKNYFPFNIISKLKFINIFFFILLFNLIHTKLKAHYQGYYSTKIEAIEKARDLGCSGTFKLKDLWMPCENEKELHKYLRKNR